MEQVLDVYQLPYDKQYPVVCMDESPKQLVAQSRPSLPLQPGEEQRVDCDYIRHGMVNVFTASEPLKGKRYVEVKETNTKKDWALFIEKIVEKWYSGIKGPKRFDWFWMI